MKINNNLIDHGTILWTNPSPTSDFSSQSIALSSSDYDMLMWISKGADGAVITAYSIKGYGARLLDIIGNTNTRRRTITYTNSISYTIENAYGEDGGTKNGALIPLYAIGYKTRLF